MQSGRLTCSGGVCRYLNQGLLLDDEAGADEDTGADGQSQADVEIPGRVGVGDGGHSGTVQKDGLLGGEIIQGSGRRVSGVFRVTRVLKPGRPILYGTCCYTVGQKTT